MPIKINRADIQNINKNLCVLNQDNPIAQKYGFNAEPFEVVIKLAGRTEDLKMQMDNLMQDGKGLAPTYPKDVFVNSVQSWTNLFTYEDGENIEATEDFKISVYENYSFTKVVEMIQEFLNEKKGIKQEKEDDLKKNVESESHTV